MKKELICRLNAFEGHRMQQLLQQEEIGNRTSSQFLRHMRTLTGDTVSDEFLLTLWVNRLPEMTRAIVIAQTDLPLKKLAAIAELICDSLPQVANVSEDMESILKKLEGLELQLSQNLSRVRDQGREI